MFNENDIDIVETMKKLNVFIYQLLKQRILHFENLKFFKKIDDFDAKKTFVNFVKKHVNANNAKNRIIKSYALLDGDDDVMIEKNKKKIEFTINDDLKNVNNYKNIDYENNEKNDKNDEKSKMIKISN